MKRVIITHGPGYEPIDEARRITNISTGKLGTALAEKFAAAGFQVTAFRGSLATFPQAAPPVETIEFTTNDDLVEKLNRVPSTESVIAVFHAAALCDYRVKEIQSAASDNLDFRKIPSSEGSLNLVLEPTTKVLPKLGSLFPNADIIGWKYELNGGKNEAVAAGLKQINGVQSAGCVVNGKAYGEGFGFLHPSGKIIHLNNADELADWLVSLVHSKHYTKADDR